MNRDTDRVDDSELGSDNVDANVRLPADEGGFDTVSIRVVECVAEATGREPTDLPPLYDVVDPDALDDLFTAGGDGNCTVSFRFEGTLVEVRGEGDVAAVQMPADD
ncbi:HalOD1 output domain-containing protein [Halobaculum marinum]|uniref:HalOD1 output domain-containing protein n=1 Tax=Halobaculum marinum TaxID=3031996 RepID=A0ABD5WVT7_9EURY|nr:HalOD1 output domain-containing protein [Halobaculum sp. DT55]